MRRVVRGAAAAAVVAGVLHLGAMAAAAEARDRPGEGDFFLRPALTEAELGGQRGGETPLPAPFQHSQVGGTVEGNIVYSAVTGNNLVTDGAFSGAAGFTTVIQNSGNNVLIQDSTVINVILR